MTQSRNVYIVDGARTPFLKARSHVGPFSNSDLAVACARNLLLRHNFSWDEINEVIIGSMVAHPAEPNVARVIALRLGMEKIPAFTVQRNCASGLQALDTAAKLIASGDHELVLAGGAD
ncbi:MAG TPA: beta-ketoacyl synthase N-terminal-like domain-containing protein, partial [Gammaproteobacteria bacterium]|nr:beta-ketoacyl synthase N-terminal-like domain-containing protein [Gammaproteobacteria bacterium]